MMRSASGGFKLRGPRGDHTGVWCSEPSVGGLTALRGSRPASPGPAWTRVGAPPRHFHCASQARTSGLEGKNCSKWGRGCPNILNVCRKNPTVLLILHSQVRKQVRLPSTVA